MTLLIAGTYPQPAGPLVRGEATLSDGGMVFVGGVDLPDAQGIAPLLGAACKVAAYFGRENPQVILGGDVGRGDGTRDMFEGMRTALEEVQPSVIVFHYMQPVMSLMREAVATVDEIVPEALLVADAGGMYAVKPAGLSSRFELMTPDVGELGFLADDQVHHPAYVSRYLFGNEGFDAAQLALRAYEIDGASRVLLVKGETDYIAQEGKIVAVVDTPSVPELEAIGGTGDTITGLGCGLLDAGIATIDAAVLACEINREAGTRMGATPASQVGELIAQLPDLLDDKLARK